MNGVGMRTHTPTHTHLSEISETDYSELSQHIIKMAQSFGILYKSDS